APSGADLVARVHIFVAVDDVAGHPHDMLGAGAVLGEDRQRVAERPRELAVHRIFGEGLMLVPANDAAGKDHPALGADAVRIALGPRPAGRLQDLHPLAPFNRSRAMIWRCTSLAPS